MLKGFRGMKLKVAMMILFAVICVGIFSNSNSSEVLAQEGDISVSINGTEEITRFSTVDGISFDEKNNVLTLNNYTGSTIYAFSKDGKVKKLEVRIVGNNKQDALRFENLDVIISGSGSLNIDSVLLFCPCIKQSYSGSIMIDGPTINMNDSEDGLCADGNITIKSGILNMKKSPIRCYKATSDANYILNLNYKHAIYSKKKISVLGGKVNVEYIYSEEDEEVTIETNNGVIIDGAYEPFIASNCVSLKLPDELKDKLTLVKEQKIKISAALNDGYHDVSEVEGMEWDADKKILTMNGYDGGEIEISAVYIEDININVVGNNIVSFKYYNYGYLLNTECVNIIFSGTGTLNFDVEENICYKLMADYSDLTKLTINGPTINILSNYGFTYSVIYYGEIDIISGTLRVKQFPRLSLSDHKAKYGTVLYGTNNGVFIKGGTLILEYGPIPDGYELAYNEGSIEAEEPGRLEIDNCALIVTGRGNNIDKEVLISNWAFWDESLIDVGDGAVFLFADILSDVVPIDINKIKATLSQNEYVYDGTNKEPLVKVGGLVEGNDYTVSYNNNIEIGTANVTITGKGFYEGTVTLNFEIKDEAEIEDKAEDKTEDRVEDKSKDNNELPKISSVVKDKKYIYMVTKAGSKDGKVKGEVKVIGLRKKSLKQIKIATKVKIGGVTYKVTSIGANAFKGNGKITKVTIGKNVRKIGKSAFADCKKLKNVRINSKKLTKIGKKAFFRNGGKKLTFKVPKTKKKAYKKMLKTAKTKKLVVKKYENKCI